MWMISQCSRYRHDNVSINIDTLNMDNAFPFQKCPYMHI